MAWLRVNVADFNMEILEAYRALALARNGPSGLTMLQRQMIAVVVSATNRCRY